MIDILVAIVVLMGATAMLAASIGFVRFGDVWMRSCAVSVASTIGLLLVLAGTTVAGHGAWFKALVIIWFVMLSTPVAGHLLMRAIWKRRIPMILGSDSTPRPPKISYSSNPSTQKLSHQEQP